MKDYIIIGSGFGGSVAAMRLAEKGYSVTVQEKGKRYEAKDFPKTNWNAPKYLWVPLLKWFGFQKLTFFKEVFILSGVGVGGGSLVYANTHFVPPDAFFNNPAWAHIKDWKTVLMPYYRKAQFMLGSTKVAKEYAEDRLLKEVANDMGRGDSYGHVDVGVYFGDTKNAIDPYFNGLGPKRKGCIECAGCMVGCRYDAKNTLDKNYLYFAQQYGAEVVAETLVTKIEYINDVYHVHTQSSTSWFKKRVKVYQSKGLVVSGGVLGTMDLLLKQKYQYKTLPNLSDRLGENLRTNSESLCGVMGGNQKLNHGVAISSVFNPDDDTHVEIVKYSDGSDALARLSTLATGEGKPLVRTAKMIGNLITHPRSVIQFMFNRKLASTSIIFLVMQTLDSSMKMVWKKGLFGGSMAIDNKGSDKVPAYIPIGQEVMNRYAEKTGGVPMNAVTEVMFNMSTTAHILGGCPMGETAEKGVVNENFQVHGYPNMFILDGSIIPCNLGVNPSLSITALSGHATAVGKASTFTSVVIQILLLDIVFSLDSVITAVGMADVLWVMITAVVIALVLMLLFAGAISDFVNRHPTLKMLALSFLILIGVTLVGESLGRHIPKGYIYFSMAFAFGVEMLNLKVRTKTLASKPVELHQPYR